MLTVIQEVKCEQLPLCIPCASGMCAKSEMRCVEKACRQSFTQFYTCFGDEQTTECRREFSLPFRIVIAGSTPLSSAGRPPAKIRNSSPLFACRHSTCVIGRQLLPTKRFLAFVCFYYVYRKHSCVAPTVVLRSSVSLSSKYSKCRQCARTRTVGRRSAKTGLLPVIFM